MRMECTYRKNCKNYDKEICNKCARMYNDFFMLKTIDDLDLAEDEVICDTCGKIFKRGDDIFISKANPRVGRCFWCYG